MTDLPITAASAPRRGGVAVPVALVLGAGVSVQVGAVVAALLFPRAGVVGVLTIRLLFAAGMLLAACRPRLRGHHRDDWLAVGAFGVALAGVNVLLYLAIERIPLGVAMTVAILGPLVLSVLTRLRLSSLAWAALALAGVVLLTRGGVGGGVGLNLAGVGFAAGAAATWAAYILLSARVGARFPGADGLALAMTVAAALTLPWGIGVTGPALLDPVTVGLGAAVALLASVLPYSLELFALQRMPTSVFAVLMSLNPALAALAGYLLLDQALGAIQLLAVGLVVVASAGAVRGGS